MLIINVENLESVGIKGATALLVEHILTARSSVGLEKEDAGGMVEWENVWRDFASAPLMEYTLIVRSNVTHLKILACMDHTAGCEDANVNLVGLIRIVMENVQKMWIVKETPFVGTNTPACVKTKENIQIVILVLKSNAAQTVTVVNTNVVRSKNVNVAMEVRVPTAKHLNLNLNPASLSNAIS